MNLEFGIEGNVAWGVLVKLQIDFEGVVRVFEKLRAANIGFIKCASGCRNSATTTGRVPGKRQARTLYRSSDDQTIGDLNRFAFLFCLLLTYFELSPLE
jgi:hypothetical protein